MYLRFPSNFSALFKAVITRCCSHLDCNIALFLLFTLHSLSCIELGFIFVCNEHHDREHELTFHLFCTSLSELQLFWLLSAIPLVGPVFCAPQPIVLLSVCFSATYLRLSVSIWLLSLCHPQILLGVFVSNCAIKTILTLLILFLLHPSL